MNADDSSKDLGAEVDALRVRVRRLEDVLLDLAAGVSNDAWRRAAGRLQRYNYDDEEYEDER